MILLRKFLAMKTKEIRKLFTNFQLVLNHSIGNPIEDINFKPWIVFTVYY